MMPICLDIPCQCRLYAGNLPVFVASGCPGRPGASFPRARGRVWLSAWARRPQMDLSRLISPARALAAMPRKSPRACSWNARRPRRDHAAVLSVAIIARLSRQVPQDLGLYWYFVRNRYLHGSRRASPGWPSSDMHPLRNAFIYRFRLDAVRRQAGADGQL